MRRFLQYNTFVKAAPHAVLSADASGSFPAVPRTDRRTHRGQNPHKYAYRHPFPLWQLCSEATAPSTDGGESREIFQLPQIFTDCLHACFNECLFAEDFFRRHFPDKGELYGTNAL
jgi:hypothetical protein